MFVKVTSGCLFAKLTSAWLPLQPEFNYSIDVLILVFLYPPYSDRCEGEQKWL